MPSATIANNSKSASATSGRHELKGLGPIITTSRRSQPQAQSSAATRVDSDPAISLKRQQKYERRIKEALKELDALGPIVTTSRLRSHAAHPNAGYIQSLRDAAADALPRGGLRTRSGQHYDRSF
jgi:hypothetical protein